MIINKQTRISKIISENEDAIEVIAAINQNFLKLKNPFLRKMLAPRVSINDAAQIGNSNSNEILLALEKIGFEIELELEETNTLQFNNSKIKNNIIKKDMIKLDVRPILETGVDPFKAIMDTLSTMKNDDTLLIINTFEPIPLLNILKDKGYEYRTERPEKEVVHTYLYKSGNQPKKKINYTTIPDPELSFEDIERKYEGKMSEIDVRDLEMPLPMVTILEAIESIGDAEALYVHHKRLPQYLIPEMEQRGFVFKSQERDADNTKLIIYKL